MKLLYGLLFYFGMTVFLFSAAYGATVAQYDDAGLELYNSQNYDQAAQYYAAALQLDPNNAAALMGAANCHYAQGQYADALTDYRKLQTLQPNNTQLTAFIQSIQSRMAPAPAGPASELQQGVALYNQKQFAASVPYFKGAIQTDPKNADAYQYLGLAQVQVGDLKEGAVALEQYNHLHPDPPVAYYATQIRGRLSPADQMWVDAQLSASGMAPGAPAPDALSKPFGVYLEPAFDLIHLSDFETNGKSWRSIAQQAQASDPTISFNGTVPEGAVRVGVEPVLKLSKNLQLGIPFSFFPVGSASDSVSNKSGTSVHIDSSLISALSIGLSLKYLIFVGGLEPYISVAPFMEPMDIEYSAWDTASGTTTKVSGSYSGSTVGALFKAGADCHLDDTFTLSPFIAYNFASPTEFLGNATYTNSSQKNGPSTLEIAPDSNNRYVIVPVPQGSRPPPNGRPLEMDLSGLEFGISFGAFF
jgi:tetratricopeptide (TPR) repeat protein